MARTHLLIFLGMPASPPARPRLSFLSRPLRRALPVHLAAALIAAILLALPAPSRAGAAITATAGASSRDHFKGGQFAFNGAVYYKWDEMVLIGPQGGIGSIAGPSSIPVTASAMVRLPF